MLLSSTTMIANYSDSVFLCSRYNSQDKGASDNEVTFPRTPGQIDRDRILYSGHFLRLAEVTQTVSPVHGYVFHNRLSHSLKVAHVARRLCERLKQRYESDTNLGPVVRTLDPDVCEAVGLAHALGHPPFGHCAETELNDKLASKSALGNEWGLEDAFEGNAQSFRIVCRLAGTHLPGVPTSSLGLNLTRQTLRGILKYPHFHRQDEFHPDKWGVYEEDREFLDFAREGLTGIRPSLEAEIMDWADDVTFAVHDLLDFYASGNIPLYFFLPQLRKIIKGEVDTDERRKFVEDVVGNPKLQRLVARCYKYCCGRTDHQDAVASVNCVLDTIFEKHLQHLDSRYTSTANQRRKIGRITFEMIEECLGAFQLKYDPERTDGLGPWRVEKTHSIENEIDLLKQFTWHYIIRGQQLQSDQIGQRKAIATVFNSYMQAIRDGKDLYMFPWHIREELNSLRTSGKTRLIVDYVSSMSEPELLTIYRQMIADNGYRH